MAASKDFYFARNKDGYVCAYDSKTHKCVDIIVSTGDDIDYYEQHKEEWIGQVDPEYENRNCNET